MDIFWFTGYTVWLILSICIGAAWLVGLIVGVCAGFHAARKWAGIKMVRRIITEGEQQHIERAWPSVPKSIPYKDLMGWFKLIGERDKAWDPPAFDAARGGK